MIPHPTAETLLTKHGKTAEGRRRARAEMARVITERGKETIAVEINAAGRSIRCAAGDHHRMTNTGGVGHWHGCANDGRTCLCECHDPAA